MKFVAAVLTLAAVATAAPAEVVARTPNPPPPPSTCSINGDNNGKVVCCNSAIPIIGQLLCNVLAIGQTCNSGQSTYCCDTNAQGGLINVSLLNCLNL
ncbi:hypothetical protein VB005_01476 [Metarhizium brunneum]